MKHRSKPVTGHARAFKALCNQLHAIGRPIDDVDKVHWFLRSLGYDVDSFSTTQMALTPLPNVANLVSKVKSFEIFQKSLKPPTAADAVFTASHQSHRSPLSNSTSNHNPNCSHFGS